MENVKGFTLWFTGLSGAGKTTIANGVVKTLRQRNVPVVLFDGDIVRKALSPDLKYTTKDRDEQVRRIANVCYITSENFILNISCTNSATKKERNYARSLINNFVEVYVKCPLEVCEQRDVKGYYHKVREGKLKNFVGFDIKYEEPENSDITFETDKETEEESINRLVKLLEDKEIIPKTELLTIQ